MALVNITPTMTSNTTPPPYVASASSEFSVALGAWSAFDGGTANGWNSTSGIRTGWIAIDFGSIVKVSEIKMASREIESMLDSTPRDFSIQGSINGLSYDTIKDFTNQVDWKQSEYRTFELDNQVEYRFFRILVTRNNGGTSVSIGELQFLYDDKPTNNPLSLRYTLPFGPKIKLDNLSSDLIYMLATENDGENEGTLRIVGRDKAFKIAKAGIKEEKLWEGVATTGTFIGSGYSLLRVVIQNISGKRCSHVINIGNSVRITESNLNSFVSAEFTFTENSFSTEVESGDDSTSKVWKSNLVVRAVYGIY